MILRKIFVTISLSIAFFTFSALAQKGVEDGSKYGKGQDSIRALENLSMYQQYYKQKAYNEAVKAWRIVFFEAPRASNNMYIHGVVLYKTLINSTKDVALRNAYVDTIMMIYDQRIKYQGNAAEILTRKAVDLRDLNKDRYLEAYDFLVEAINIDRNQVPGFGINAFMQISLTRFLKEEINQDQMVSNFATSMDIMEHKLKMATNEKDRESEKQILDNVQLIFSNSGAATCETLVPVLKRKYDENPDDVETINAVLNLLKTVKCEDTELYAKVAEKLHSIEPSANSAFKLGAYFIAKKDFDKAIPYYEQAITLETNDSLKAGYYSDLALIMMAAKKNPVEVRRIANLALSLNPNDGRSFIVIGRLYASYNSTISDDEFEKTTAYWAAVDKFMQAKRVDPNLADEANGLISTYSAYFPTQETAFFNDLTDGQEWTVPGWIGETTRVRVRK
ncbi:MAG: hypothetical protein PHU27_00435 [Salinivirgaceae bacterium]|nr:hypothetical protein [Salinivirgaceae bacterium]MDD4745849.1 hypothetical protein [Salinivirgaceae bacterium]MDY0281267.1 hypothetical protein [Salinivirgaceae bacterium]